MLGWAGRIALVLFFAAGLLILVGRHFLMPEIAAYRTDVERQLSNAIGLPVKIERLSADWPGLYPVLEIGGLQVLDAYGRSALSLDGVTAEIGWSSLWHFGLRLHRLNINGPELEIRRNLAGTVFIAGLAVQGETDYSFANWLLAQGRIVVRDARLVWNDEMRAAPPLELRHLDLDLRNSGKRHSFGLTAETPQEVANRLDVRGNMNGRDPADLASWSGAFYVDVDGVDLHAWSPWIDLPRELTRGRGGLRFWLDFANLQPTGFNVDLRLADVVARLRPDLPELDLEHLQGGISGQRTDEGFKGEIRQLSFATRDGIVVPPTDAKLKLDNVPRRENGVFSANNLDLGALADLAGHLPLPEQVHARLKSFAPKGRLSGLEANWRGPVNAPEHWQARTRFEGLALLPYRELPGFAGISGSLEGDATAGVLRIDSRQAHLDLPTVFQNATLPLSTLQAELRWRADKESINFQLARAAFRNDDADGEAAGNYRYTGAGPGEIDLSAKLTRAVGNVVWRYMPLVVNKDTRDWLQTGITGGRSENATLRLKGPLSEFPFRDGKGGIFQVKGQILGATLDYADGWPKITGIDGDLLFEGVRMVIRAERGNIMGTALSNVTAEIPDLEVHEEMLLVAGQVTGETQQFLDFIEASPVGERIQHFTETIQAKGRGALNLKLEFPLRRIAETRVQGSYRFADNELKVLPELPVLSAARGEFSFTADRLQAKGLRANLHGSPVNIDVTTSSGGTVRVDAKGTLKAQGMRQSAGLEDVPWLDHLSGETSWRGSIAVKKPAAEVRIESSLEGLSSSLPEPFNKSVRAAMPLLVTGRIEPGRGEWSVALDNQARLRLQQAGESWRGHADLGEAARKPMPSLPERGIAVAIAQPMLDLDAWRALLPATNNHVSTPSALPLTALDIKSGTLRVLEREFHGMQINGSQLAGRWRINLDSRETRGQLTWDEAGAGRIAGRLAFLNFPPAAQTPAAMPDSSLAEAIREMPAVDLVIDSFRVGDMALGEVRIKGETHDGLWQAKLDVKNEAASLASDLRWRAGGRPEETRAAFRLDVSDWEKLLGRMGMPDAVRRGNGWIKGYVAWPGAPSAYDLNSLSGKIETEIEKGQFKKLEPGVGRLLGVLSLQSLPRRITLDFRDIFSDGFAFDSIAGAANFAKGVMTTDEIRIRGPAAKILLSGKVSLPAETQDLKVRIQPALGESIAVGAMIVNPVAGAVAWAAQKVLNDPLDQAFAFEYAVTGGWSDPHVEEIKRPPAAQTAADPKVHPQ